MLRARTGEVKVFLVDCRADRLSRIPQPKEHLMPKGDKPQGMAGKRGAPAKPAKAKAKTAAKKTAAKKTAKKR
jgi:hypothetical protein